MGDSLSPNFWEDFVFIIKAHIPISNLMRWLLFAIVGIIINQVKYFSMNSTHTLKKVYHWRKESVYGTVLETLAIYCFEHLPARIKLN